MRASQWMMRAQASGWTFVVALCMCSPACVLPSSENAVETVQQSIEDGEEIDVDDLIAPDEVAVAIHGTLSTVLVGLGAYVHAAAGAPEVSAATLVVPDILIEFTVDPLDGEPAPPPARIATAIVPDIRIEREGGGDAWTPFTVTIPEIVIEFGDNPDVVPAPRPKVPARVVVPDIRLDPIGADFEPGRGFRATVPPVEVEV